MTIAPPARFKKPMKPRAFAIATGQTYYFTGKPCKRGHFSKRLTSGGCVQCNKESSAKWRASEEGKSYLAAAKREWVLQNADRVRESRIAWRRNNPDKSRAYTAKTRQKMTPEQKMLHLEQMRAWHKSQPLDRRYRPAKDKQRKQERKRQLFQKYRAAYVALKELGIEI